MHNRTNIVNFYYFCRHNFADEKRKLIALGTDCAVWRTDDGSVSCTAYRLDGAFRPCTAALHGKNRFHARKEAHLDISLFRFRDMERHHDLLGVQRHCRRRSFRHLRQRSSDVHCLRPVPLEQEEIQGCTSICLPDGHMDSMGKVLFRCGDLMAMAGTRKLVGTHVLGRAMV